MNEKGSLVPFGRNSPRLQIEEVPISLLKRNTRSPRVHPEKQIVMLARNIDTFGFLLPCLIDNKNRLLCGNARVEAAERLGMTTIPVIRIGHLSEAEQRAFILADAKLAEYGTWNPELLREEIQFFTDFDIDFDFSIIGFETAEVDVILESAENQADDNLTEWRAAKCRPISSFPFSHVR